MYLNNVRIRSSSHDIAALKSKILTYLYINYCPCGQKRQIILLKVPKRENFHLPVFTLSNPIWAGDLGWGLIPKIDYSLF